MCISEERRTESKPLNFEPKRVEGVEEEKLSHQSFQKKQRHPAPLCRFSLPPSVFLSGYFFLYKVNLRQNFRKGITFCSPSQTGRMRSKGSPHGVTDNWKGGGSSDCGGGGIRKRIFSTQAALEGNFYNGLQEKRNKIVGARQINGSKKKKRRGTIRKVFLPGLSKIHLTQRSPLGET